MLSQCHGFGADRQDPHQGSITVIIWRGADRDRAVSVPEHLGIILCVGHT